MRTCTFELNGGLRDEMRGATSECEAKCIGATLASPAWVNLRTIALPVWRESWAGDLNQVCADVRDS